MSIINLLLLGRTGNGKSSIGNSILGYKAFKPRGVASSITYDIILGTATINDRTINVVDGPGVGDTCTDVTEDGQSMIALAKEALSLTSDKFNALLLVLKYGVRYTTQERDAVKMVKTIFGEDVLKNYGIVVMSYGDMFEMDTEDDKISFQTWCSNQTGDVQNLFDECGHRCILFNNRATDEVKETQRELMKIVESITANREPYNSEDFHRAEPGRIRLLVTGKLPELESKTEILLNSINQQLQFIGKEDNIDHTKNITELNKISDDLQAHIQFLKKEDKDTGLINNLLLRISVITSRVRNLTNLQQLKSEYAENERERTGGKNPVALPKKKQENFQQSYIDIIRLYFGRCIDKVRSVFWMCVAVVRSPPDRYKTLFESMPYLLTLGVPVALLIMRKIWTPKPLMVPGK